MCFCMSYNTSRAGLAKLAQAVVESLCFGAVEAEIISIRRALEQAPRRPFHTPLGSPMRSPFHIPPPPSDPPRDTLPLPMLRSHPWPFEHSPDAQDAPEHLDIELSYFHQLRSCAAVVFGSIYTSSGSTHGHATENKSVLGYAWMVLYSTCHVVMSVWKSVPTALEIAACVIILDSRVCEGQRI